MFNKFLIQLNSMEKNTLSNIFQVLKRLDIQYDTFFTISNKSTISDIERFENKFNYITIGGVSFLRMIESFNSYLKESVDYDINKFDQFTYKDLNLPLLNHNASYHLFNDVKNKKYNRDMFIKPSKDIKSFNGGILLKNETLLEYLKRTQADIEKSLNENIIVSELQHIFYEYRFFMYNDEILECSRYKWNNQYSPSNVVPDYIKEKAIEYSKLYKPKDIFVIDLAETNKNISIVEYQCWNISAFYDCNLFSLLGKINEIKTKKEYYVN